MTTPGIWVAPCCNMKVVVVIVSGFIASLKVAESALLRATPRAALAGTVELTVGGVTSGAAPVVKLQA